MYYVTTVRAPFVVKLGPHPQSSDRYVGTVEFVSVRNPQVVPLFKPPWGSLVAIDMSSGEHRWRSPVGSGRYPAISDLSIQGRLGWPTRSFALATKSLVLVVQQGGRSNERPAPYSPYRKVADLINLEPRLYAYDKASGRLLAEIPLPANAGGAADDLHGRRQAVHRDSRGRREPHRGARRPHPLLTFRRLSSSSSVNGDSQTVRSRSPSRPVGRKTRSESPDWAQTTDTQDDLSADYSDDRD